MQSNSVQKLNATLLKSLQTESKVLFEKNNCYELKDDNGNVTGLNNKIESTNLAPKLFNYGLNNGVISFLEKKYKQKFLYRGFVARKEYATKNNSFSNGITDWHLDTEDKFCYKLVLYLSDVSFDHGPFSILKNTNPFLSKLFKGKRVKNENKLGFIIKPKVWHFSGKAGDMLLVNTGKIWHRGNEPKIAGRKAIFFCYNSSTPDIPSDCGPLFSDKMRYLLKEDDRIYLS